MEGFLETPHKPCWGQTTKLLLMHLHNQLHFLLFHLLPNLSFLLIIVNLINIKEDLKATWKGCWESNERIWRAIREQFSQFAMANSEKDIFHSLLEKNSKYRTSFSLVFYNFRKVNDVITLRPGWEIDNYVGNNLNETSYSPHPHLLIFPLLLMKTLKSLKMMSLVIQWLHFLVRLIPFLLCSVKNL